MGNLSPSTFHGALQRTLPFPEGFPEGFPEAGSVGTGLCTYALLYVNRKTPGGSCASPLGNTMKKPEPRAPQRLPLIVSDWSPVSASPSFLPGPLRSRRGKSAFRSLPRRAAQQGFAPVGATWPSLQPVTPARQAVSVDPESCSPESCQ